jgi:hypothetical protein
MLGTPPRSVPYNLLFAGLLFRQRRFLFGDDRALGCHFGVELGEGLLVLGHIVLMENGLDGAFGNASFAIDAFIRVDVKHLLTFIKAFDGAYDDAVGVFAAEAGLSNNVSHWRVLSLALDF